MRKLPGWSFFLAEEVTLFLLLYTMKVDSRSARAAEESSLLLLLLVLLSLGGCISQPLPLAGLLLLPLLLLLLLVVLVGVLTKGIELLVTSESARFCIVHSIRPAWARRISPRRGSK
jgi:hypothetical protein